MTADMLNYGVLTTIDSHTAGHPTRVIVDGLPQLLGSTVLEKFEWFQKNLDDVRTLLLHEPRGHSAMVGAVITESNNADFGAFFLGSYNYLPMCGHATIGLAVTLDHQGQISPGENGKADFDLEVPAGIVHVAVHYIGEEIASVSIDNVPSFVAASGIGVTISGQVTGCDIAYGGNWYALVEADAANVSLTPTGVSNAMTVGSQIKADLNARIAAGSISGVSEALHSVLFYRSERQNKELVSRQLVVLASNKFDRSPCGTGTSARLAQLLANGEILPGEQIRARNILDVDFLCSAALVNGKNDRPVLCRATVKGLAHITGFHRFLCTTSDPLPNGFLCS